MMLLRGISCLLDMTPILRHASQFLIKLIASLKKAARKNQIAIPYGWFSLLYDDLHMVKHGTAQAPGVSQPLKHIFSLSWLNPTWRDRAYSKCRTVLHGPTSSSIGWMHQMGKSLSLSKLQCQHTKATPQYPCQELLIWKLFFDLPFLSNMGVIFRSRQVICNLILTPFHIFYINVELL